MHAYLDDDPKVWEFIVFARASLLAKSKNVVERNAGKKAVERLQNGENWHVVAADMSEELGEDED